MSFTSDYLKKKQQLQSNPLQRGAPRFTLPTTSSGVTQKASTVKPAATKTAAGSSTSRPSVTVSSSNKLASSVSNRFDEIRNPSSASTLPLFPQLQPLESPISKPVFSSIVQNDTDEILDSVLGTDRQDLINQKSRLEQQINSARNSNVGGIGTFGHSNDSNAARIRALMEELDRVSAQLEAQSKAELADYEKKVSEAKKAQRTNTAKTNLARRSHGFTYEDSQEAQERAKELLRETENAQRSVEGVEYKQKYQDITRGSDFTGQFLSNYDVGKISEDEALAWNTYLNDPSEENLVYAENVSTAKEAYQSRNALPLGSNSGNALITRDFAGYLPQFLGQNIAGAKGALAGAALGTVLPVAGTASGAKAGYAAGRAMYGYETARGRVFKSLLDAGVPEEQAKEAANDEAVISSVIEGGDAAIDILTLGFNNLLKKGGQKAAKSGWKNILKNYATNVGSEAAQEWVQEGVSIANQSRSGTGVLNLVGETAGQIGRSVSGQDPESLSQMNQAAATGARIAALVGGSTLAGNTILANAVNRTSLPSSIDTTRQANANLNNPEFVERTTSEAIQNVNQNLNRQPVTLPSVQAQETVNAQPAPSVQTQTETTVQRRQGVQVPIETRTWQDAGNRKVNAFQYDHPELRPYYAEAARALKYDLASSVKGERMPIYDASSGTRDIIGYTGTKRSVTEPIAQALDNAKLSYAQIDKAIDDLIADNGQENYAAAKKLELVLDDMLTNGYTDSDGYDVPPNQAYLEARERANNGGTEYSMSEDEWNSLMAQEPADDGLLLPMVNGPESSVGAARKGFDPWSAFQGTKSEFFPEGANAARPVDVPTTDAEGNPIRKTASTAMGAKAIPDEVVGEIQNMVMSGDLSYTRMTDQDSINRAVRTIEADGFQRSMEKFTDSVKKGVVSKDLATLGQQLLVNAANAGDANATAELLSLYAQMETTAGQAVQAASILRKLEPTAQLYAAQKAASNLEQTLSKKLNGQNITIDPSLIDEFNQQTDQAGRDVVLDKIYQNIADQVPSTWKDKWNAWRYLAMLGNPRTHVRNVVGNVGFQPVRYTKDRIASLIESGVNAASGGKLQRTKSFAYNPDLYAAAWQDYDNVADVLSGNKYDDVQSIINDKRTIFKTKPLEAARRGNSNLLGIEDMWFKRITYADALSGYLNANGVTAEQLKNGTVDSSLMSAARDYAGQEALKATYNDKNVVSNKVVQAAKSLGTFGEAVLPFKRTPANILVRGVEYSPVGLAKGLTYDLYKVKNGEMTGAQAIDNIAAGMTGSGLMLLGAMLAASGIVTGGAGEDDKQAEFNELTGGQTYALNLPGGGSVTLDWLAPEALPFFMGVQAMQSFGEEGLTGDTITSAFASISEPMLEMSMLQSLNDLIDNVSYAASNEKLSGLVGSSLISYLTQAIPTIGGQIERTFEDKRYSTYTNKDSLLPTDVQYALGKASAKIPGWDFQQVPYIDAWGREEETGLLPMRALNNFLNPAYTSSLNVTPVDEEIQRLYNSTGIGSVIPSRADKSITVNGEDINLSGDKYVEYAKAKGETAFDLLSSIIDTSAYKGLSDDEKVKLISDVYEYANSVGKAAVSNYKLDGFSAKVQSTGVDPADYILYRSTADQDGNDSVTQSESASALLPMKNLTTTEKGKVWQSQNSSWSEKKNPFTGALASAGIDASTATSILNKYSEVYNMDIKPGEQAAELSKFLDGLDLTTDQRAVVDDTYKFYNMFPAKIKAYSVDTMSNAAQSKWHRVQAWGMSEDDYLKYYPMVSSGKKAECIQKLQDAGMTQDQANYFWSLVKNK